MMLRSCKTTQRIVMSCDFPSFLFSISLGMMWPVLNNSHAFILTWWLIKQKTIIVTVKRLNYGKLYSMSVQCSLLQRLTSIQPLKLWSLSLLSLSWGGDMIPPRPVLFPSVLLHLTHPSIELWKHEPWQQNPAADSDVSGCVWELGFPRNLAWEVASITDVDSARHCLR